MPEVSSEAFDVLPPVDTDSLAPDAMAADLRNEEGNKLKKIAKLDTNTL